MPVQPGLCDGVAGLDLASAGLTRRRDVGAPRAEEIFKKLGASTAAEECRRGLQLSSKKGAEKPDRQQTTLSELDSSGESSGDIIFANNSEKVGNGRKSNAVVCTSKLERISKHCTRSFHLSLLFDLTYL